ncbi:unnamed protein product [Cunninghamella echinulata]
MNDCSLIQTRYWQLLNTLLNYYSHIKNNDFKQSTIPIIRISLITSVTSLLQHLYTTYKNEPTFREILINDATQCVQLLLSRTFQQSYRPTLEQMTAAIESILSSLTTQLDLTDKENLESEDKNLANLLDMAQVLLERYDDN